MVNHNILKLKYSEPQPRSAGVWLRHPASTQCKLQSKHGLTMLLLYAFTFDCDQQLAHMLRKTWNGCTCSTCCSRGSHPPPTSKASSPVLRRVHVRLHRSWFWQQLRQQRGLLPHAKQFVLLMAYFSVGCLGPRQLPNVFSVYKYQRFVLTSVPSGQWKKLS